MGLEKRGNNYYYYQKRREGERVTSTYCGKGDLALAFDALAGTMQDERAGKRAAEKRSREEIERIDEEIDRVLNETAPLIDAIYLLNGFHQHTRTWRRKRNAEKD